MTYSTQFKIILNDLLDRVRPPLPFDLEPPGDKVPISYYELEKNEEIRQAYNDVRLWHDLKDMINR